MWKDELFIHLDWFLLVIYDDVTISNILLFYDIKEIDSMLLCFCTVINDGRCQNVVRTSVILTAVCCVPCLCTHHILMSFVIYTTEQTNSNMKFIFQTATIPELDGNPSHITWKPFVRFLFKFASIHLRSSFRGGFWNSCSARVMVSFAPLKYFSFVWLFPLENLCLFLQVFQIQ